MMFDEKNNDMEPSFDKAEEESAREETSRETDEQPEEALKTEAAQTETEARQTNPQTGQAYANPQAGTNPQQWTNPGAQAGQGFSQPQFNPGVNSSQAVSPFAPPKPKKKSAARPIAITAACALVAGVVFGVVSNVADRIFDGIFGDNRSLETTTTYINKIDADKTSGDKSVEAIVEGCLPSVVSITNKGIAEVPTFFGNIQQESVSTGTGIIIGKNETELLIVTNYHVVAGSRELTVVFAHDGDEEVEENAPYIDAAQIKGYDADKDIAVIAVKLSDIDDNTMQNIAVATIGDSNSLKMGSGVIAIGNALGYGQSTTRGIVSAVGREITIENADGQAVTNKYIQTDAAINKGNSGGALLDMNGALVGINSAKISASGVEGMGYAIPISDVEELIGELMNEKTREEVDEEKRGYLGITGVDISEATSKLYGIPEGVMVDTVVEGSPAEKAGLMKRDIITKLDRTTISSMNDLKGRLAYYEKGEKATLTIMRPNGADYEEKTIEITLGSSKEAGIEE